MTVHLSMICTQVLRHLLYASPASFTVRKSCVIKVTDKLVARAIAQLKGALDLHFLVGPKKC